jgi:hypothetical protein
MLFGEDGNPIVSSAELGARCTIAAQNLWRKHQLGIERTTKEAKRSPRSFGKGFSLGVACLIAEFHKAGVNVDAVLKELGL